MNFNELYLYFFFLPFCFPSSHLLVVARSDVTAGAHSGPAALDGRSLEASDCDTSQRFAKTVVCLCFVFALGFFLLDVACESRSAFCGRSGVGGGGGEISPAPPPRPPSCTPSTSAALLLFSLSTRLLSRLLMWSSPLATNVYSSVARLKAPPQTPSMPRGLRRCRAAFFVAEGTSGGFEQNERSVREPSACTVNESVKLFLVSGLTSVRRSGSLSDRRSSTSTMHCCSVKCDGCLQRHVPRVDVSYSGLF